MTSTSPPLRVVDDALVTELLRTLGRFRRRVRRAAPRAFDAGLTEAEAELLRHVARHPGTRVGEAAAELGLADNTVSTLVTQLKTRGLLLRSPDPEDRRVGRLSLTAAAQRRSDVARERRHAVIAEALGRLEQAELAALVGGIAAIAAATAAFDEVEVSP